MRKTNTTSMVYLLLALALALPAAAQEDRCSEELAVCVRAMADTLRHRGWAGLDLDHNEATGALVVSKVVQGSPAQAAGFRPGDRLMALNGIPYGRENEARLKEAYKGLEPGATVTWTVRRDGGTLEIPVVLAPLPEHIMAQWIGQHVLHHLEAADEEPAAEKVAGKP